MYKVYAALIQKRLALLHDHNIRDTQLGFRSPKEQRSQYSSYVGIKTTLFLDWKQAFAKIDHRSLLIALKRFGVHPQYLDIITDIYIYIYRTQILYKGYCADYSWGKAHTRRRQGCPLSPYPFVIMMSVLCHEVDTRLRAQGVPCNNWSIGKPLYDLECADDTALMAVTLDQLQEFLHAVEVEASLYNMLLNKDKTELLVRSPTDPTIMFANGDPQEIKYLGTMISWTIPPKTAIKHKVALANASFSKLHHVWCSKLPWGTKSRIFHSSIVLSLEYSLETCPFDKSHHRILEGHYFRLLRRSPKI